MQSENAIRILLLADFAALQQNEQPIDCMSAIKQRQRQ